ncbi:MAG TPA: hypothetical protein VGV61_17405, partial [Thermoanaerobaculia bacterium]|nr:hypothetical protein [Thermoanaerobaculia bacterium]
MSTSFCSWLLGCVLLVGVQSGRPLTEALQELQKQGLALVFTSRLVTPDMKVLAEPVASDPRARAEALLAPYGLTVLEEAPGLLVVVRAEGPAPPAAVTHGRPPPPHPQPVLREEIVVRPSRLTLLAERPEPSSFGLDREAIERLPHLGDDLFRAASLLPGIAANDISAELSVRGGRPDELKIVLDGQELYGAYHLEDYANALSIVPARLLGSASLITGALPASQGDRMSGLLDLRTLDPPAGRRLVLGLSVLDALASSAGSFRSVPGGWLLTARRGSLELARRAIGNEHPEFWDVLGKVETTTPFGVVGAHLLLAGDHLGIDRSVAGDSEHLANNYRTDHGWLTHQAGNERLLVSTLASWARLERSRGGATSEEKGDFSLRDRRRLRALGLVQTWNLQHPSGSLEWGWEGHRYEAFFDYMQRRDPAIVILSPLAAG